MKFPIIFLQEEIFSGWRHVFVMQILKKVYKTFSTLSSMRSFSLYTGVMVVHSVLSPLFLLTLQFCLWPWNCSNGCIRINIGYMFTARKSVLLNSTAWTHYYYYYWLDHNNTYNNYHSSYQAKSITDKLLAAQLVYGKRNFIIVIKTYPDKSILSHTPSYKVHFYVNSLAIPRSVGGSRLFFPIKILCVFISTCTSYMLRLPYACSRLPKYLLWNIGFLVCFKII